MAFGLTDAGFEIKRLGDIKLEIEEKLQATLGSSINLLPESVFGQLVAIFAERESLIWEGMDDVYNSAYPDTALGASLDNVVALTGIVRQPAQPSIQKNLRLFGTSGTIVPLGTVVSVLGNPTARFLTDIQVTLVTGVDEVQLITFSLVPTAGTWRLNWNGQDTSNLAFNANAAAVQAALQLLPFGGGILVTGNYSIGFTITFAGISGKQSWPTISMDSNTLVNGVTPVVMTIGTTTQGENQGTTDATAESDGPTQAIAGLLTVIETPVTGLTSVLNVTDAEVGRFVETDLELRSRRGETLQVAGKATVDAIRAALLNMEGVTDVIIFENDSLVELNGIPPKSYETVVNGADDADIAQKLWDTKPAGIRTFGDITENATDSLGFLHPMQFSRPTLVPIYVELDLTVDSTFPLNGIAAAKEAIVTRGSAFGIGGTVIVYPRLISALDTIPGIVDVVMRVGIAPSPTLDDNIPIDPNEIATFDTTNVGVTII